MHNDNHARARTSTRGLQKEEAIELDRGVKGHQSLSLSLSTLCIIRRALAFFCTREQHESDTRCGASGLQQEDEKERH